MVIAFASVLGMGSGVSAGVVAYWDFSSDSNGVTDVTGNCHSLTNSGVAIQDGAAVFDGNQAVFRTARSLDLRSCLALTVEFFVKTPVLDRLMMLMEQSANTAFTDSAFFFDANDIGLPGCVCNTYQCGTGWNVQNTPTGALSDGGWHHVAMVFDPSKAVGQRKTFYFDGVAQGIYGNLDAEAYWGFANETLYIGSRADSQFKFAGSLDDVRISDTALAPAQFLKARTEGAHPVVAYWRFDGGAELTDASGNGNALAAAGVTFTNGVARLDGSPASFNTAAALNLAPYTNLTVEFFMRTSSHNSGIVVLEQTDPFYSNPGAFIVDVNDGNEGPGRVVGGFCTSAGLNLDMTPVNAADDGQWHHVAVVYDSSQTGNGLSSLYFDGVLASESFYNLSEGTPTPFINAVLYIGSRGNTGSRYIGELDDIRITAAALRPGQFLKAPSTEIPRTIAYWPFSSRQPLEDASGNGRSLSGFGMVFKDDAAVFDGVQSALSTLPRTLNLRPYSALTVECFVKSPTSNVGVLVEHSANFNGFVGGFIGLVNEVAAGQFDAGFALPGGRFNIDSTAAGALSDGQWHHVALVYDPSRWGDDHIRVYLDRVQQGKRDASWNSESETFFLNSVLYIGSRNNAEVRYAGELDDLRITGAALEPSEFLAKRTYFGGTVFTLR